MKKTIITAVAFLVLFGFAITGAFAQAWTWSDPITVTTKVVEMAGDPKTDAIYGIDELDAVVPLLTGGTLPGTAATGAPAIAKAKDLIVGFSGLVYTIDDNYVGILNSVPNPLADQQPKIPDGKTGIYKHISSGDNGKLYVLFETVDELEQYLLVGNPPVQEELVVKLNPQSLNLGSKGNWVTCLIQIPGYDIQGIDPSSIVITQFEINGTTYDVNIPVDGNAPHAFTNNDKLMVKFVRYNKTTPDDPESLVGVLSDLLPAGPSHGKVPVTAIVQATHTDGTFSGEVTFQVIVPKAKKGKP